MKTAHMVKRHRTNYAARTEVNAVIDVDRWMTPREAAEFLRIGYKRLLNMSSSGQVPYHKLGRSNRYLKSELIKMLLESRKGLSL